MFSHCVDRNGFSLMGAEKVETGESSSPPTNSKLTLPLKVPVFPQ